MRSSLSREFWRRAKWFDQARMNAFRLLILYAVELAEFAAQIIDERSMRKRLARNPLNQSFGAIALPMAVDILAQPA
jgi:hypothetical protein